MTALNEPSGAQTDARVGKVLSAVLQSVLARQLTGSDAAAAAAFLVEFDDEVTAAVATGSDAVFEFYGDLAGDTATALFSVVVYVADQLGRDPADMLRDLVRTYRKAGRAWRP